MAIVALSVLLVAACVVAAGCLDVAYGSAFTPGSFVTTWKTAYPNETITIPVGGATGSYTVDWGDGSTTTQAGNATHTYAAAGTYTVQISGDFTRIFLASDSTNAAKMRSIEQWGSTQWDTMESAFRYAQNMEYRATDAPNLSGVADMGSMFLGAYEFTGDPSSWDVSSVTDMSNMFRNAFAFNGNVSSWDVSSVTDMSGMFVNARSFNQPIGAWNTSKVTDMSAMFVNATSFNQPLNSWDVSKVTDMYSMFWKASSFNQPLNSWDVSGVINMSSMFQNATSFNQPLSSWNVSSVEDMSYMFHNATSFNRPLASWEVSRLDNASGMFFQATSFNQPLNSWYISSLRNVNHMFEKASSFNQPLDNWNVSRIDGMKDMLFATPFAQNLAPWYIIPEDTEVEPGQAVVTTISAQNSYIGNRASYTLAPEDDYSHFTISGHLLKSISPSYAKETYDITILAKDVLGLPEGVFHPMEITITVTQP